MEKESGIYSGSQIIITPRAASLKAVVVVVVVEVVGGSDILSSFLCGASGEPGADTVAAGAGGYFKDETKIKNSEN